MKGFTIEKAQKYVAEHTDAKLLDTVWVNSKTPMRFVCACGRPFTTDWNHFRSQGRTRCTECAKTAQYKEKRLTEDDIRARISARSDSIWVGGEYKNQDSELILRCSCGNEFTASCQLIFYGSTFLKCPTCSSRLRSSYQRLSLSDIANYASDHGVELLSTEYSNAHDALVFQCSCGRQFKRTWNDFYSKKGYRCPRCTKHTSKGEWAIEQYLTKRGIFYEAQKRFPDCVDQRPLPFDFYIPSANICVEFDGEQHYREVAFGTSRRHFETQRAHDKVKDDYCKSKGITLVRIPYYNIEFADIILESMLIPR